MAKPSRPHRKGTYEIEAVVNVDLDELEITYRTAAAFQAKVLRLNVARTPAARQMLQAMADSIKVGLNGDADSRWESSETLRRAFRYAQMMLDRFDELGFTDFSDAELSIPVLQELYEQFNSNVKRSCCWLLARVLRDNHLNGVALGIALRSTRFAMMDANPYTYDDAVAVAIEKSARAVYKERFDAQRDLFRCLGYDTSSRAWLRLTAAEVIERATNAHPGAAAPGLRLDMLTESGDIQIAWALTHPEYFGFRKTRGRRHPPAVVGTRMRAIGIALYPDRVTLTAAAILHCLGENAGFNVSTMLEKNIDSLIYIGSDDALEHNVKSRNQLQDTRPTRLTSIFTPGGVVESLTGLTRFSRQARAHLASPTGTKATVVDRLYVEHAANPEDAAVLHSSQMHSAWEGPYFASHWETAKAGPIQVVPLKLPALRLVAQRRAMAEGVTADVHGHSDSTKTYYLAHTLPDYVFNKHAVAAQNSFHDKAIAAFKVVADATDGPAASLAAIDPSNVMDVEIGLCVNNGAHPDGSGRRCGLGIIACFVCPNGYRTVDNVPGLLAAVKLGDIIEHRNADEWENGQASQLRFLAQACLDEFPDVVVGTIRRNTDLRPHILSIAHAYNELRDV